MFYFHPWSLLFWDYHILYLQLSYIDAFFKIMCSKASSHIHWRYHTNHERKKNKLSNTSLEIFGSEMKNTKNILKVEGAILRQKKKSLKLGTMSSWTIKSRMKPEEHTMLVLKKDKVPMDSFMPAASTPSSPAGTLTGKIGRIDEFC